MASLSDPDRFAEFLRICEEQGRKSAHALESACLAGAHDSIDEQAAEHLAQLAGAMIAANGAEIYRHATEHGCSEHMARRAVRAFSNAVTAHVRSADPRQLATPN